MTVENVDVLSGEAGQAGDDPATQKSNGDWLTPGGLLNSVKYLEL